MVAAMLETIAHRGPDDRGIDTLGPVCLGAVRLAILDLSPRGHMPMFTADGGAAIVYNGEVYNFRSLRDELAQTGVVFRSESDTEVVLEACRRQGLEALHAFRGMFAFALYEADCRRLTLVRDRFGVKPLYFAEDRNRLLFASEIKALLPQLAMPAVDATALAEWWLYRNLDGLAPRTLFAGIRQVPPGHQLIVEDGRIRLEPWYDLLAQISPASCSQLRRLPEAEVVATVGRLLEDSVQLRLVADVPVGVLLSGGLDSSLVTMLAARHQRALTAFHVSVAGSPEHDERPYAARVAAAAGIPLTVLELKPEDFWTGLCEVAWLEDLPITHPNSVAYYRIAQRARAQGVIVLQSGEGADELFGGYAWSHRRRLQLLRLQPWLDRLPTKLRDALTLLAYGMEGLPITAHRFRDALPAAVVALDWGLREAARQRAEAACAFLSDPSERAVMVGSLLDLSDFLAPLLRRLDRTTMGASVECREPFLDVELVHTALALPAAYKVGRRADKWLLKQLCARHLPRALVERKKMGFPLPLADWLRPLARPEAFRGGFLAGELRWPPAAMARILAEVDRRPYGAFGLFALELWGSLHLLRQEPAAVAARFGLAAPQAAPSPAVLAH
jgi:asparagine synthase (glutamine-hydrolysing)